MTDALFKQGFKTWMLCSLLESTDETRHISAWRRTAKKVQQLPKFCGLYV